MAVMGECVPDGERLASGLIQCGESDGDGDEEMASERKGASPCRQVVRVCS